MGKLKNILRLKNIVKKNRCLFFEVLLGIVLVALLGLPAPYIMGIIVDDILINDGTTTIFYYMIGTIGITYLFKYFISAGTNYLTGKLQTVMANELKLELMTKVMNLPMNYLNGMEKGYLQARLSESETITTIFSGTIISTLLSLTSAIAALSTMLTINLKLGIIVLLLTPFFFLLSKLTDRGLTEKTKTMMESNAKLNMESFEILNGIEDIKMLNGKSQSLKKFRLNLEKYVDNTLRQNKAIIFIRQNILLASDLGNLFILIIAGILIMKGEFSVGLYTTFSLYSNKIFSSAQLLSNLPPTLKQLCLSIERVYEIMDVPDEDDGEKQILTNNIETIELRNVFFQYKENDKFVIENLNLKFSKGERVLIQGENGSGKTTLIKLLLGIYESTMGEVQYNNINIRDLDKEGIRNHIGIVSQHIFLFKGTVLENILYGQKTKTRRDVEKLICELNLYDYIARLPQGLDTEIIQNTGISGGQIQVLAFIRAMLSDKEVIILDEPVSNIDIETKAIILNILNKTKFNGILIVVSHQTEGMDFLTKVINL